MTHVVTDNTHQVKPSDGDAQLLASAFRADGARQENMAPCLNAIYNNRQFFLVKKAGHRLLRIDRSDLVVLEVGCGVGFDSIDFARELQKWRQKELEAGGSVVDSTCLGLYGRVIGVDLNEDFLELARAKLKLQPTLPLDFCYGNAAALSEIPLIADNLQKRGPFVDRIYIERILQHLPKEELDRALSESWNIMRHGGRIVAIEPIWERFAFKCGDEAITKKIIDRWVGNFFHSQAGNFLPEALERNNFMKVRSGAKLVLIKTFPMANTIFDVERTLETLVKDDSVTAQERDDWLEAQKSRFFECTLQMRIATGVKKV